MPKMPKLFNFRGGVHPEEHKDLTSGKAIQSAALLDKYVVPTQQHIGAPAKALVKKKDTVLKGQPIAESGGFISANIHAPTSGTVTAVDSCPGLSGTLPAIEITSDGEDKPFEPGLEPLEDWRNADSETLKQRICDAGLAGMGGAAFPTHVKLSPPPAKKIDVLIINGVECEPYLTADHRLMLEEQSKLLTGIGIIARILGARKVYLAIERNKPDAIEALRGPAGKEGIEVIDLRVRYPQGAEKQLIYAISGRKVPTGGLPMDVGCVVQNVGTAVAITEAVTEGEPLIERVTTVTGSPVKEPGNWKFRIGTPLRNILEATGGVKYDPAKLIMGGPMMGISVANLDIPLMKNTSGVLLMGRDEIHQFTSEACISCGQCVDACPMRIMPGTLSVQIENERFELAEQWRAMDCIECGCCAYVCPTNRPLVQHFKRAKSEITAKRRAEKQASES